MSGKIYVPRIHYHVGKGIETRKRFVIPDINHGIGGEESRESAGKTGTTGFAEEKLLSKVSFFFFFTTAVGITAEPFLFFFYFPFFLSFFRRLLLLRNWSLGSTSILSSADCMQKFNGAWKLKDTSNFME